MQKKFPHTILEASISLLIPFIFIFPIFIIIAFVELPQNWLINISFVFYFIGFIIVGQIINANRGNKIKLKYSLNKKIAIVFTALVFVYQIILNVPLDIYLNNPQNFNFNLLNIASIVVLAPIIEEIIFRGYILNGLLTNYSNTKSIIYSSLLFAIIHFNFQQGISAFIFGLFVGYVFCLTKSTGTVIIIHILNNATSILGMYINSIFGNVGLTNIYGSFTLPIIVCSFLILIAIFVNYKRKKQLFSL